MLSIEKPAHAVADVFALCISKIRDEDLKERLESVAATIASASVAYDAAAAAEALHEIQPTTDVDGSVTQPEMIGVYGRMVDGKHPARLKYYDPLMALAPRGFCPLCGQRTVSELDHHLEKARFPVLAVTPSNLVPSCGDCNELKRLHHPTTAEEQTLHPYFDRLGVEGWLVARVDEGPPPALVFSVRAPAGWSSTLAARVRTHLRVLRLGALYSTHAGAELVNMRDRLVTLHERGGTPLVREDLLLHASSCERADPNSWQAATYRALAANAWFWAGGFNDIPT